VVSISSDLLGSHAPLGWLWANMTAAALWCSARFTTSRGYALERLLYRLGQSKYHDQLLLKGAMLFAVWGGEAHRPTRDVDLLGFGTSELPQVVQIFQDICQESVEPDGLEFLPDTMRATEIREDQEYQGVRVLFEARLENAIIPIQIDIGYGDAVTPAPEDITYPTVLDFAAPKLRAYPIYTVVAEKFQAMVWLGIANSRMKDFYDLWIIMQKFPFYVAVLASQNPWPKMEYERNLFPISSRA
jgi:hypothetical protein